MGYIKRYCDPQTPGSFYSLKLKQLNIIKILVICQDLQYHHLSHHYLLNYSVS